MRETDLEAMVASTGTGIRPDVLRSEPLRTTLELCWGSDRPAAVFWGDDPTPLGNVAFRALAERLTDPARALAAAVRAREAPLEDGPRGLYGQPIHTAAGVLAGVLVSVTEAGRLRAELAAEREQTLAVIAHDLKNPLNVVSLSTYQLALLQVSGDAKDRLKKQTDAIKRSTKRINDLISDVLDLARLDLGTLPVEVEPCGVDRIVAEALDHVAPAVQQRAIALETRIEPDLRVACDRERTVRVLAGLLQNAITASPDRGLVRVDARRDAAEVRFEVHDTGPGVRPEDRGSIFDRSFLRLRGEKRKLGRGLPLAKGVIEAQKGRIWLADGLTPGAVFAFTLPRLDG